MKRLFIGVFVLLFSFDGIAVLTYTGLNQINLGRVIRGSETGALSFVVDSDATDTLTKLVITSIGLDFHTTDSSKITDLTLYIDDGDGVFDSGDTKITASTTDYTTSSTNQIIFTINETITTAEKTILLVFTVGPEASITDTATIDVTEDHNGSINVTTGDIDVVGVDSVFTDLSSVDKLIYDADATKFGMLQFELSPDSEGYFIEDIIISNNEATFDSTSSNDGVSGLYLYKEVTGSGFSKNDDALLKSITNVNGDLVTFNSTSSATFSFSSSDGDNRKITTDTTFYVVVDLGPSTNIWVDDDEVNLNLKVTAITGVGVNSTYSYGPINILNVDHNNRSVSLAGMTITSVENIFPSMNVAPGLTDVPILKFTAKSVGIKTRLSKLVLTNAAETFAVGNDSGITNLSLVVEDDCDTANDYTGNCVGDYSGYGFDGPNLLPLLDTKIRKDDGADIPDFFRIVDSSTAEFIHQGLVSPNLDIGTGNIREFYVLADFGSNMPIGSRVSLNVSAQTEVSHDKNHDGLYDDTGYKNMAVGSNFPMTVKNDVPITVLDASLTVDSKFSVQDIFHRPGLYCDTDGVDDDPSGTHQDGHCSHDPSDGDSSLDSDGATKKLVAGMRDVLMYVITINVKENLSGVSFEFTSPKQYFSSQGKGMSKLAMYLDKDQDSKLSDSDVFLGSTTTFENFGKVATISNVALPQGREQQVLVMFDLGQRIAPGGDETKLSMQLTNVFASTNVVAAVLPNPPKSPYVYTVAGHQAEITSFKVNSGDSNTLERDTEFDVTVKVDASTDNDIKLKPKSDASTEPLSRPKFYYGGVDGPDRSYEFTSIFSHVQSNMKATRFNPFNKDSNGEREFVYNVKTDQIYTEGNYYVDFDVYYEMAHDDFVKGKEIVLSRSKGVNQNYKSAVELHNVQAENNKLSLTSSFPSYSWTRPQYVEKVEVDVNSNWTPFYNYQSIPQNTSIKIHFANDGEDIDVASIVLEKDGTVMKSEDKVVQGATEDYYSYDPIQGIITITSVGNTSGSIMLYANDHFGRAYPATPIIFYTSESLEINQFMVYPNPYSPSLAQEKVYFGFSITQPAEIEIRIFDAMGREVTVVPKQTFPQGQHSHPTDGWNATLSTYGRYLSAGTYYIKLIATDIETGAKEVATTKWAVY